MQSIYECKTKKCKYKKRKKQKDYSLISPSSSSSSTPRIYKTLLHLMSTSPKLPVQLPSMYSSVLANWKLKSFNFKIMKLLKTLNLVF